MLVAVTGAQGVVGRAVITALTRAGHSTRPIDRTATTDPDTITADACDYPRLRDALDGTDALIHLAGIPNPHAADPPTVHNTNVTAGYNALHAAVECGITTVALASSINAIGGAFSRRAHYERFPVDEQHPTYNEDPYSLSKWIAEAQADSIARRHPHMTISSLRIHGVTETRDTARTQLGPTDSDMAINHLWGYVRADAVGRAFEAALHATWQGHETINVVAPDTISDQPSLELARRYWPHVELRGDLTGHRGFYDCGKAQRLLGWTHTGA
ncbi:NAD(P)-dependent oxidoreductase [Saccharopolyspora gloriosae]|uniref:NAD-dependent epimerase/dehydratase family protein n=1 Tax=Saccharopolyspora gloriosae TaxID=455344 RepID=UPI001FB722E2|nr:NAD(P)-dependent oxidoreductase [Saccharopolyspora gloriosae]